VRAAPERREAVKLGPFAVRNVNRTVGGILSGEIARRHGAEGLSEGMIEITSRGSAGQSFAAWLARGVTFSLRGETNDYLGKGLSGGVVSVCPPEKARFRAEENTIVGNTVLYGATAGRAFFRGLAGERFAVRNSGASAVVVRRRSPFRGSLQPRAGRPRAGNRRRRRRAQGAPPSMPRAAARSSLATYSRLGSAAPASSL
jgi:glutamate synthase domain-containing protein 3